MGKAYLMIQNVGVAPKEAFTLLGASDKDNNDVGVVGKHGSGNKMGSLVCLRNRADLVIYSGNLKMQYGTKPQTMGNTEFERVFIKYSGKEGEISRSYTEDLGYVLNYGSHDWSDDISLALREFVSNALDESYRIQRNYEGVQIETVDESKLRAKSGFTRVFVELTPQALSFYDNINKWFLHFGEPESLKLGVLPKADRNLDNREAAVIYRRGVRVREFEANNTESLFDYNFQDMDIDESRKANDWSIQADAGRLLRDASKDIIAQVIQSFADHRKVWEQDFSSYNLDDAWSDNPEEVKVRKENWTAAFAEVAGGQIVSTAGHAEKLGRKGLTAFVVNEAYAKVLKNAGAPNWTKVLSEDDMAGRQTLDAFPDAILAVDVVWEFVQAANMTNGKEKPAVKCFDASMNAGSFTHGYYRDGTVYINANLCGGGLSTHLKKVALHEIAHYASNSNDLSPDFADYAFDFAAKLMV